MKSFISDAEMQQLVTNGQAKAPAVISDADMAKMEAINQTKGTMADKVSAYNPATGEGGRSVASGLFDYAKNAVVSTVKAFQALPSKLSQDFSQSASDIISGTKPIANTKENQSKSMQQDWQTSKGLAKGFLRPLGDIAGAVITPLTSTVGKAMEESGAQKGLTDLSNFIVDKSGLSSQKWFQDFAMSHPNAEEDFGRLMNLAVVAGADPIKSLEELKTGTGKLVDNIKGHIELRTAESNVSKVNQIPDVTGKILQTKPSEMAIGQRALGATDLSKVRTYADLSNTFQSKIDANTQAVDTAGAKNTTQYKPSELDTSIKSANDLTRNPQTGQMESNYQKVNYVSDGLDELKNYYSKIKDYTNLQKVLDLESKFKTQGLTPNEINGVARMHGRDLTGFNANGELASGLSKQAAENTRAGIKETFRNLVDENTKATDMQTSDLIKAKGMADEMATKVQKLQNTIQKAGLLKQIGNTAGKAVNFVLGGAPQGFFKSFFPDFSNLGADVKLNPIQLQDALQSNIRLFDELNKMNPADAVKKLNSLIEKQSTSPKIGLQTQDVSSFKYRRVVIDGKDLGIMDNETAKNWIARAEQKGQKYKIEPVSNAEASKQGFSTATMPENSLTQEVLGQMSQREVDFAKSKGIDLNKLDFVKETATPKEILSQLSSEQQKDVLSKIDRPTSKRSASRPILIQGENGVEILDGGHSLAGKLKENKPLEYFIEKSSPKNKATTK